MLFREMAEADVPGLFVVRVATRENALTLEELTRLGITEDTVRDMLSRTHCGWLCEADGRIVGFAMGNKDTGEMWVIAVLPDYEGLGIGGQLLGLAENWLWSQGWEETWLTTDIDPSLRAYGFYLHQGWSDLEIKIGCRYMTKKRPASLDFSH